MCTFKIQEIKDYLSLYQEKERELKVFKGKSSFSYCTLIFKLMVGRDDSLPG